MVRMRVAAATVLLVVAGRTLAQSPDVAPALPATAAPLDTSGLAPSSGVVLPMDTVLQVTVLNEITSIKMKVGDVEQLQIAADAVQNGVVIIPRGAPVKATITWRTGKGIGGKSAKFDLTFNSVTVGGHEYALKGKHRQEGKGNTVAALLGSMVISGHSAVIESGQMINAFTAEPIPAA